MSALFQHRASRPSKVIDPPPVGNPHERYALACKSYLGSNSSSMVEDLSGHFRHLVSFVEGDAVYPLIPNVLNGKAAYLATADTAGKSFFFPDITEYASDYTLYFSFMLNEKTQFDLIQFIDTTPERNLTYQRGYLSINNDENRVIFQKPPAQGPILNIEAGELVILTYQLNSSAGLTVRKNGKVLISGLPYIAQNFERGPLFARRAGQNLIGYFFDVLIAIGNDTAAQINAAEGLIASELGQVI